MPDKLREAYEAWIKAHQDGQEGGAGEFQAFQGGFTAGAVAMRERAVQVAQDNTDHNKVINGIGSLSDIPA